MGDLQIRTYTYIAMRDSFVDFVDAVPHGEPTGRRRSIEALVAGPEDEYTEFKASAFADIRAAANRPSEQYVTNAGVTHAVMKTVCGFLNSPRGGDLVLGILEHAPFMKSVAPGEREAITHWLKEEYLPLDAERYVVGLEPDFRAGSGMDWDRYRQKLQQAMRNSIFPMPLQWVSISEDSLLGKRVAIVHIRPPDADWCYVLERRDGKGDPDYVFYVREGNTTRAYQGPDADR